MCSPNCEQERLVKTNEGIFEALLASLLDVNKQINALDGQQLVLQRNESKEFTVQTQQEEWKQIRTELTRLRASLEQFLSILQEQHSRFPHQSLR